jgi:aminomethyltransferase
MDAAVVTWDGTELWVSRSGYTGEDGFEISVPAPRAEGLAQALLAHPEVQPVGLGARDSLRLEAGLPLYGQDIDLTATPVEANLAWSVGNARRTGGARAGGFPGADRILRQIDHGVRRVRVGLRPEGRAPMRGGTPLLAPQGQIGHVTSGGFGPSVGGPVAMGYVDATLAAPGTALMGEVRGKVLPVTVAPLPFVPPTFKR